MDDAERVGERIAATRKALGLTQRRLAETAGVSKSMLAKVESGHATASNGWIGAVAKTLGVDIAFLAGHPNVDGPRDNAAVHRLVPEVRRVLAAWDLVDASTEGPRASLDELTFDVAKLHRWRHATAYDKIGTAVPGILAVLNEHTRLAADTERQRAFSLLTQAYRAANTFAHKLGYTDLSLSALDRMEWAATNSGDDVLRAVVDYVRSGALTRLGEHGGAIRLLNRAINLVEPLIGQVPEAMAVLGSLHMKLIGVYGAMADSGMVAVHAAEATRIAERTGPDRTVYETVFGPVNIKLHELSARNDMAQPGEALAVVRSTNVPAGMPRERVTYYWMDVARAHLLNSDPDAAIEALYEARAAAPLHFANSALVRNTIYTVAAQQRRANRGLRSLAQSVGIRD